MSLIDRDFEFVLIDAPWLAVQPDPHTFARQFSRDVAGSGIVTFDNQGRNATLVAPAPGGNSKHCAHLAAFVRGATMGQQLALWRALGIAAGELLSDDRLWISTHGGGVAWLHVRLDARPKYYHHSPFKQEGNG